MASSRAERGKRWVDAYTAWKQVSVERGIFSTVLALNVLGFPTESSCEGHLDRKNWHQPYPHVTGSAWSAPEFRQTASWVGHLERETRRIAIVAVQQYTLMRDGKRRVHFPHPLLEKLPDDERQVFEQAMKRCERIIPGFAQYNKAVEKKIFARAAAYERMFTKIMSSNPEAFRNEHFRIGTEVGNGGVTFVPVMLDGTPISVKASGLSKREVLRSTRSLFRSMSLAMQRYYMENGGAFSPIFPEQRQKHV